MRVVYQTPRDDRPNGVCLECYKPVETPYGWYMRGCTCCRFCDTLFKEKEKQRGLHRFQD